MSVQPRKAHWLDDWSGPQTGDRANVRHFDHFEQTACTGFFALGEDCGPATMCREAFGPNWFGSAFFDNLYAPLESVIRCLDADFEGILKP